MSWAEGTAVAVERLLEQNRSKAASSATPCPSGTLCPCPRPVWAEDVASPLTQEWPSLGALPPCPTRTFWKACPIASRGPVPSLARINLEEDLLVSKSRTHFLQSPSTQLQPKYWQNEGGGGVNGFCNYVKITAKLVGDGIPYNRSKGTFLQ